MRIPRLHVSSSLTPGETLTLNEERSHYLASVLRLKPGQSLRLFNGQGGEFEATVEAVARKAVVVRAGPGHGDRGISPLKTELAVAISRGERLDWVIQKATELGVDRIRLLWSERVEVRLKGERLQRKHQHWQRIAISACEQSGRTRLPELPAPEPLRDYLQQLPTDPASLRLLLHPPPPGQAPRSPLQGSPKPRSARLLVGPEGGWSEAEVQQACAAGFVPWSLGPRILRTETAPVAALAILQYCLGDAAPPG